MDTFAPSNLQRSAIEAGTSASWAEDKKTEKYEEITDRMIFVPLGFETVGSWGRKCRGFLSKLGKLLFNKTGRRSTSFLFQRLSLAILRGNSASILAAVPRSESLEEIFRIP